MPKFQKNNSVASDGTAGAVQLGIAYVPHSRRFKIPKLRIKI